MKPKTYSKKDLANLYNIHPDTLKRWLVKVPDLDLTPRQRILTPKQVQKIFDHIGMP